MCRRASLLVLPILLLLPARDAVRAADSSVAVAAAANLTQIFQEIGPAFEASSGIHSVFSFGSTAQLSQQIENGAPWDVFAAADTEHIEALSRKGLLVSGSTAVYATGVLALWVPPASKAKVSRPEELKDPSLRVLALANPSLAPYGQAARETLNKLGIWNQVESRIVYAENIAMARQYGATGNADAVFTALSLVLREKGRVIQVPEELHQPIRQALGVVAASKNQAAARKFAEFLLSGKGHELLLQNGYR